MSRTIAFVVALEDSLNEEDMDRIVSLLKMIRGVASVRPVLEDMDSVLARDRATMDIRKDILAVLFPK